VANQECDHVPISGCRVPGSDPR